MSEYKLQALMPQTNGFGEFVDTEGYWCTYLDEGDLDYMKSQATVLRKFYKTVRIIQERQVIIEETVVPE